MPKTSEEIIKDYEDIEQRAIETFLLFVKNSKDSELEEDSKKLYKERQDFLFKKWFSSQELKDKLKEAEKRIDEQITHKVEGSSVELIRKDNTKQILNDCFGVGK